MTVLKTKQIIFILGHLSGLSMIHVFTRQTVREKRVFVSMQLLHFRLV